jgi:hypothetical protein
MTTTPDNWEAVKSLFEAALAEDVANRSSFLKQHCTDANLRSEVMRLLAEHDKAASFLSTPVPGKVPRDPKSPVPRLSEGLIRSARK